MPLALWSWMLCASTITMNPAKHMPQIATSAHMVVHTMQSAASSDIAQEKAKGSKRSTKAQNQTTPTQPESPKPSGFKRIMWIVGAPFLIWLLLAWRIQKSPKPGSRFKRRYRTESNSDSDS